MSVFADEPQDESSLPPAPQGYQWASTDTPIRPLCCTRCGVSVVPGFFAVLHRDWHQLASIGMG